MHMHAEAISHVALWHVRLVCLGMGNHGVHHKLSSSLAIEACSIEVETEASSTEITSTTCILLHACTGGTVTWCWSDQTRSLLRAALFAINAVLQTFESA